jgi:hypothetical protein
MICEILFCIFTERLYICNIIGREEKWDKLDDIVLILRTLSNLDFFDVKIIDFLRPSFTKEWQTS